MANELKATNPAVNIEILGVNMAADYPYNSLVTSERSLPWLQDNGVSSAWAAWQVTWRDVRILDGRNRLVAVYNLSFNDLAWETNRASLKRLFLSAATFVDTDHDDLLDDWEMLHFGDLSAAPAQDPDHDGFDNFTEYAFGTDPTDARSKPSFVPSVTGAGGSRQFGLVFRRRAGSCLDYFLEGSPDLAQWNSGSATVTLTEPFTNFFDGTGTGQSECRLNAPIPSRPAGFLRMRAAPRAVIEPPSQPAKKL